MRKYVVWVAALFGFALLLASCGSAEILHESPTPTPSLSIFSQVDQATEQLLSASVEWHAPKSLTVDRPTKLALTLGEGSQIERTIRQNVPNTSTIPAGTVRIGPDVQVTLYADPAEAIVTPNGALDASTTSNVQLYYQWSVRPVSAGEEIALTAHIVVPLSGTSHEITYDIPLNLPVDDTWSHRANQVFTNWGTWSAIVTAIFLVYRKVRRKSHASNPELRVCHERREGSGHVVETS